MKFRAFSCLAALVLLLPSVRAEDTAYLFTSFHGGGDGLHFSYSTDARHWTELPGVFLQPQVGSKLFRDAHLMRGPDGVFRLVWTTGWKDKGIGYATSTDLMNWSEQRFLPLMEKVPGTVDCWAPETFYDARGGQYVVTWSSEVEGRFSDTKSPDRGNHRTYFVTTRDFQTCSEPKLLLDPGFDHIDATILERGGSYVAVIKEGDKQGKGVWGPIHVMTASSVLGPYRLTTPPVVTERAEGPALLTVNGETLLYVDFYTAHHYGAYATRDWLTWHDVTAETAFAPGQRHGTALAVPGQIVETLRDRERQAMAAVPKPILDGFTADPGVRVFGDTYYVYPTSDKPNWLTTDFSVWSSKNLINWKKEGMVLDVTKDLKWANLRAWAPDAIERNGKYYFYFCANGKVGVGVADQPTGPFRDALDKPLLERVGKVNTNTIDPYPFIDGDGQAYLYFGNGIPANVFRLKPDMITLDGDPVALEGLKDFREGIVVFQRKGKYYFMWSVDDARSDDYRVAYGTAPSPLGPVTCPPDNVVLRKSGLVKGTGHHSVVNVPGTDRWYMVYHRHAIPGGSGYQRETCLARMAFNADGTIKPVDPLAPVFPKGSAGEPLVNGKGAMNR